MAAVYLPQDCHFDACVAALANAGVLTGGSDDLNILVPGGCFIWPAALAFLCSFGLLEESRGRSVHVRGDEQVQGYLARMGFHWHLGLAEPAGKAPQLQPDRIPILAIGDDDGVKAAVDQVCDLVLQHFDDGARFVPALEWAANEIIDNILLHAEAPVPGMVCAQVYPKHHELHVAICDAGRGIKASLETSRPLHGHGQAIDIAVQRGVTRDPGIGQGNGMAGALQILKQNRGSFEVWTGDALWRARDGQELGFQPVPQVVGTGILLVFETRRPVDLKETWIGSPDWSYLDQEAQLLAETGGIRIPDTCTNTGTREPARLLRNKVQALLIGTDEPVMLDFTGVRMASSSFLDELLGRLAASLGPHAFRHRVTVTGLSPTLEAMANVVIGQRLDDEAPGERSKDP